MSLFSFTGNGLLFKQKPNSLNMNLPFLRCDLNDSTLRWFFVSANYFNLKKNFSSQFSQLSRTKLIAAVFYCAIIFLRLI